MSKFVGTGPSSYKKKKKNLPGHGLTKAEKHLSSVLWDPQCLRVGDPTMH